ncbi:KIF4_21_27 [Lepeophtheirus salmonis]|uniref:Kinesin-like protein n=2 Tax=Lepeophtheirus salmonis TaxID=72036 RepID=A0A7R8HDU3_LEPSM|nr:KIF4_21_27 [Lepeophtheirus salmonis]CAF3036478.1 KIF4_21_27 [Lepeophtheirus salmonis]
MLSQVSRRICSSAIRRSAGEDVHPVYLKIKEVQKQYQVNNGLLIHERHGNLGKILQGMTAIVFVAAAIQSGMLLGQLLSGLSFKNIFWLIDNLKSVLLHLWLTLTLKSGDSTLGSVVRSRSLLIVMMSTNGAIPVRVAVRFRPLNENELNEGYEDAIQVLEGKQIFIKSTKNAFTFDFAFGNDVHQEEVYSKSVKELIPQLFKGYNVTVLAYGQTGSGKTYTMGTTNSPSTSPELIGIIPRAIKDIFEHISQEACEDVSFVTKVSFIELYKENLYDLLSNKSQRKEECYLDIREDPKIGLHISNLSEFPVDSLSDTIIQLEKGSKKRITAATAMNNGTNRNKDVLVAKFQLVDLAGSERQKKTKATGERLKEGIDINKGLLALGNVIAALGEETHSSGYKHIPYRDSKLTRLLQDSIGGNSYTLMIACFFAFRFEFR